MFRQLGAAAALLAMATSAGAQTADETALRQTQAQQFEAMFNEPDNLDLMFQYAITSIRLQDYEAAITTLDRMLIFNPDLPRVKLELAAAYFRIGSYPVARFYFEEVVEDAGAAPEVRERAEVFLAEINERTQTSYFSGVVGVGAIFTDNANSGPDDRGIEFNGQVFQLTGNNVTSQTDVGASISAQLSHVYDLGGTNADTWRTEFAGYSQRFANTQAGAADIVLFKTGPRLSLTDERYGPKIRPYVELDHVRSAEDSLYSTVGFGFELSDTIDNQLTLQSDLRIAYRDFHNNTPTVDKDGINVRANIGLTYFQDQSLTWRGKALFEYEGAETDSEKAIELGAEGGFSYRYDSGFDFASRRWRVNGSVRGRLPLL